MKTANRRKNILPIVGFLVKRETNHNYAYEKCKKYGKYEIIYMLKDIVVESLRLKH